MKKELTIQEVAYKLAKEGCFEGYAKKSNEEEWVKKTITGIDLDEDYMGFLTKSGRYSYCAIEVPDEYVPFDDNERNNLKLGDIVKSKDGKMEAIVTRFNLADNYIDTYLSNIVYNNKDLFYRFVKEDGSVIGKLKGDA